MTINLAQDYAQAQTFVTNLCGSDVATFQVFKDNKSGATFTEHGRLSELWKELVKANNSGSGVFITVQETDGSGRRTEDNIVRIRALFVDCDKGLPKEYHLQPSAFVITSEGKGHLYWFLSEPLQLTKAEYQSYINRLISFYNGDKACKDLARVMRLPGSLHMKAQPQLVQLKQYNTNRYSLDEVLQGLPELTEEQKKTNRTNAASTGSISWKELKQAYDNTNTKRIYDKHDANICLTRARKFFADAVKEGGGVHDAIVKASVSSCVYALVHGVDATVDKLHELAVKTYKQLERDADISNRESDDKRAIRDGLGYALANLEKNTDIESSRVFTSDKVNVQWVSEMNIGEMNTKVVAVKSTMGTGKTKGVVQVVQALPSNKRVLVLSHRVLLVAQWLGDMNSFLSYNDNLSKRFNLRSIPQLICSYDSAHKLRGATYDYVILDEPDQAFPHALLGNTSIRNVRRQMAETLRCILYNSTKVILTSAHVTDLEVDLVLTLAETQELTAIENTKLPVSKQYYRYSRKKEAEETLHRLLAEGKRCFVATDSCKETYRIVEKLTRLFKDKRIIGVTRDTDGKDEMVNANDYVRDYDCVVASPTMGTGVDINERDMFHCVFGIFVNNCDPIGYLDLVQAVNRVRYPADNSVHVYINPATHGDEQTKQELATRERVSESNIDQWCTLTKDGTFAPIAEGRELYERVQYWQASYLLRQHKESRYRSEKFWKTIVKQGHTVTVVAKDDKTLEDYKREDADVKAVVTQREYEAIVTAKELTATEAKDLRQTKVKTREQKLALEKHNIKERLRLTKVTVDDVEYYRKRGQKLATLLWLSKMTDDEAIAKDSWTIAQYSYDRTRYQQQRIIVLELLQQVDAIVSKCNGKFTSADISDWKEWQAANKQELRDLGIKVDNSKPALALTDVLKLMEYTVDKKQARVVTVSLSNLSSISKVPRDSVTKTNAGREWVYSFYRTPEQKQLWQRMQAVVTEDSQSLEQTLQEFLRTQVTAFTIAHVQKYLGELSLLPDALARELEKRGYVALDGIHWLAKEDEDNTEETVVEIY